MIDAPVYLLLSQCLRRSPGPGEGRWRCSGPQLRYCGSQPGHGAGQGHRGGRPRWRRLARQGERLAPSSPTSMHATCLLCSCCLLCCWCLSICGVMMMALHCSTAGSAEHNDPTLTCSPHIVFARGAQVCGAIHCHLPGLPP